MRYLIIPAAILTMTASIGCSDRAEDACARIYDECGKAWSVPDKTYSRDECVEQIKGHEDSHPDQTETLLDCVDGATCDTVLACLEG